MSLLLPYQLEASRSPPSLTKPHFELSLKIPTGPLVSAYDTSPSCLPDHVPTHHHITLNSELLHSLCDPGSPYSHPSGSPLHCSPLLQTPHSYCPHLRPPRLRTKSKLLWAWPIGFPPPPPQAWPLSPPLLAAKASSLHSSSLQALLQQPKPC